ncbi:MAG: hypothetical protein CW335_05260 [Clostridiales bacterium]|nr:hypothetical protein [Clostridiales bacterium]
MKKKYGFLIFLGVFLLMCLWPLVGMAITGPSEAAANEILAAPPALQNTGGSFNADFLNDTSDYFADHFASRQELTTVNAKLEAALFGESASEDVILGKDGWLFYQTTLDDYQGQNLLSDREIWAASHSLSLIQEYAQQQNASFLFTVVPNKNSLYPEFMPDRYIRSDAPGNAERLTEALRQADVSVLDLYEVLKTKDLILYQRLDSHWSNLGAALAHDAITDALGKEAECFYQPEQFTAVQDHSADLYQMLYPAGTEKDIQLYPDRQWSFSYDAPIRSVEDQMIRTSCAEHAGKLLMFRDSFGNTLHPFMAESYGAAVFFRAMPYDLSLLDSENADTLVIEIVERNIDWLVQRAPIFPAPVRQIAVPAQSDEEVNVRFSFSEKDLGMLCCQGTIGSKMDIDSPIFLICDGTVFEASPAGSGDQPFTAYLPCRPGRLQVMFIQDGCPVISQAYSCE